MQCVQKFLQGPTYMSSEIVPQKEAEFPAMTVCPQTKEYKEDVLRKHGIPTHKQYNDKGPDLMWSSNQTDVSEIDLFKLATHRFDELVKRFYIRFFDADVSCTYFLKLSKSKHNQLTMRYINPKSLLKKMFRIF